MRIDLLLIGEKPANFDWGPGSISHSASSVSEVYRHLNILSQDSNADAILTWDQELGIPDQEIILRTLEKAGDIWHAGLKLGMAGLPKIINYIQPVWPLNYDPDPSIECTSWRISIKACLFKCSVLKSMGHLNPNFESMELASLEMGLRYISQGVFTRHIPELISDRFQISHYQSSDDEAYKDLGRFVFFRYGPFWLFWAAFRMTLQNIKGSIVLLKYAIRSFSELPEATPVIFTEHIKESESSGGSIGPKVSVLIPTLGRYPYLNVLLSQIRTSTIKPHEVIIVDQNPENSRDASISERYQDLPIIHIFQDNPGQCTSRNEGLQRSTGDFILFLDDDDEIYDDLISQHINCLEKYNSPISCGHCHEVGAEDKPFNFTYIRSSDIFSTNNSLIKKCVLNDSGLFDIAYNKGSRADGDLFMRLYGAGFNMVLRPDISVLHHHAPSGGLRAHKARKVTFASSRKYILDRHIPEITEIYLTLRYYNKEQLKEMLWLRFFGMFRLRGPLYKKILKILISFALAPHTLFSIRKRLAIAKSMLEKYPQIPRLLQ